MKPDILEFIRYRLARSRESLDFAAIAIEKGFLHEAVNRMYYACFYAVSALLLSENVSSPTHQGVLSLFNRHWVNTGRVPRTMGRFYRRLLKHRQEGDYQDLVVFDAAEVASWFDEAKAFRELITGILDPVITPPPALQPDPQTPPAHETGTPHVGD